MLPLSRAQTDHSRALKGAGFPAPAPGARLTANQRRLSVMSIEADAAVSVQADVVSDVVCPWCYIGKRRLEAAMRLNPGIKVEINWRPYFLNPWIPREGIDRKTYLETKFGSVERYAGIAQRVTAAAAAEGLTYAADKISRQPNTIDCHRIILWANGVTDPASVKQRLMDL